jgi:transcriptional regulator with XRE-family HTH domain
MSVGQRLRAARKQAGLTQVQVAARAGTVGRLLINPDTGKKGTAS